MSQRTISFALVAVCAALIATIAPGTVAAAADTIYCLNGVSTTLPATITASSVTAGDRTRLYTEYDAGIDIGRGGVVYYGFDPAAVAWAFKTTPATLEAGYATITIALGACNGVTHVGVCKLLPRADGTTGLFQEITVADWNDKNGKYFDAPAASWVEGLGLTCDDPVALGYKAAGYAVAWGGAKDPVSDPAGTRAAGRNNIYPYYVR